MKIIVPEGMLKAAHLAVPRFPIIRRETGPPENGVEVALEAALRWLSENPIVPTREQVRAVFGDSAYRYGISENSAQWFAIGWQRRMFLAPESEQSLEDRVSALEEAMKAVLTNK